MSIFVYNLVISIWVFASWFLSGIGFTLTLLSRSRRSEAFLLAPLLGCCFLILVGLFELTVLLKPLTPFLNLIALEVTSFFLCLWSRRKLPILSLQSLDTVSPIIFWFPLMLFPVFAWIFHKNGFHLLVASSDQLQYCLNSKQILEEMHRNSPSDFPVPRYDHVIYDLATRTLPYERTYRRGAELILAMTKAITGLSYAAAFPVLILNILVSLSLAMGFFGLLILKLSRSASMLLQLLFISASYFLLLHAQGSLALTLGIGPGLLAVAYLMRVALQASVKEGLLAVIFVASYFSIYAEPVVVNIIFPISLLLAWRFFQSYRQGLRASCHLILILILVALCAPYAIDAVVFNTKLNVIDVIYAAFHSNPHPALPASVASASALDFQPWNLAPVVLGLVSYYDDSAFNGQLSSFIAKQPWLGLLMFSLISCFALGAYLKAKKPLTYLYALLLFFWTAMSFAMFHQQDGLRFARSLHYALPFILIGLALLGEELRQTSLSWQPFTKRLAAQAGFLLLFLFIVTNFYSDARSMHYLASHQLANDPRVLRFDEQGEEWLRLQAELHSPLNNQPILFSGFTETVRPLAIASMLAQQPHVLGRNFAKFWPLYRLRRSYSWSPLRAHDYDLNTHIPELTLAAAQQLNENYHSKHWEERLIERSEKAIVPQGYGYPEEWLATQDVYAAHQIHFDNIGEVVYRWKYSLSLASSSTSELKKDDAGHYRDLVASGPIIISDCPKTSRFLILDYQGKRLDLTLSRQGQIFKGHPQGVKGRYRIIVPVEAGVCSALRVQVRSSVKLRALGWQTVPPD